MKSSDIKVLTVKKKYNFSGNENEILIKPSFNLEEKPLIYNNNHNINKINLFNDNSFFLDDYEIVSSPINIEENKTSYNNKNIDKITYSSNETKIANPTKLAKIFQKQPIFALENEQDFYVSANILMQNNNKQINCTNCLSHLSANSSLPLFNKTGNDKYDKKITKINAKTNYYRARYEQIRVKKQLQIDWKCCSKHISANCHFAHQDKNDVQTHQLNNLNNLDQQHNQLMINPLPTNEMLDIKSTIVNPKEIEQIKNNGEEDFNFAQLDDSDIFSQDFDDLPQQNSEKIDFNIDNELELLTNSNESEKKQSVSDSLIENNVSSKNNKLKINFVETNPNQKHKTKFKRKFEENSVYKLQSQVKKAEIEDNFDNNLFSYFNDINEPVTNHVKSSLTIDPLLVEKQQSIPNYDKQIKLQKVQNQDKKNINLIADKVITWNNFLNLSLKSILFVTIVLAICLGLLFKQQINSSKTHWNIMWLLNQNNDRQKSAWLDFIYNNAFLIASLLYSFLFIVPLIIFGRNKMFIISLTIFMIGLVTWTAFACLGFFKYGTFKVNKIIALLETTSLVVSWLVFTLFLSKLIKYNKQTKISSK